MDEKIRKLDEQLMKHRDVIKKTRPGPAQDAAKRRALNVSLCLAVHTLLLLCCALCWCQRALLAAGVLLAVLLYRATSPDLEAHLGAASVQA